MLASTTAVTHLLFPPCSSPILIPRAFPSVISVVGSGIGSRPQFLNQMSSFSGKEMVGSLFLGCPESKFCWRNNGFMRRCKDLDGESDFSLEAEILEFMKRSKKPGAFPSKKELVEAGREDLVAAIAKRGGWLSLGWDLEEEGSGQQSSFRYWDSIMAKELDNGVSGSFSDDSSEAASSSSRSIEASTTEDDAGIAGILNRLEKERNLTLGFPLKDKEDGVFFPKKDKMYDRSPETSTDVTVAGLVRSSRPSSINPSKVILNDSRDQTNHDRSLSDNNGLRDSPRPEMWRTWSTQRAGYSDLDFEAAEISYDKKGGSEDVAKDETFQITEGVNEPDQMVQLGSHKEEIDYKQIRSRIKHLESELSSVLSSLRSKADEAVSEKGHDSSSDGLRKLSDAWEFQETEIMHAQDKLRSTRAKLAVLEGKMAMAIMYTKSLFNLKQDLTSITIDILPSHTSDAQKIVDEKQKRINDARRALRLLRTAFIVWPNSASEVLLVGSYDGWTTQRKMEKSSTGIFSLCLKLYPGRYEIKFIVDGEWRVDPLRPIVYNEGYQNNVLIIT